MRMTTNHTRMGHEQKQPILMVEWHRELQLARDGTANKTATSFPDIERFIESRYW